MERLVLDELEKEYQEALKDIKLKIQQYMAMPETQSRIYHRQYQENLKKQIEAALEKLHSDEYTTINQYLHDSYTDAFVGTMYDLHIQGVPVIAPIDQNAAIKAVMTDTRLNKPLYQKLGIDVNKLKRTVSSEISRGIASGLLYEDIARNIQFRTNAPIGRAKTIVRTEGHRIQQASAEDARQVAKSKGADVVKQWDSTMDGKTRTTHRQLDGQIRETDEQFELGNKKAMYPGDFGDPAEDCNCRCVALTRSRSALDADELATMKERAKSFGLDKTESFKDFEKKYLKASEEVAKEPAITFVPAKTIEEAEKAISEFYNEKQFGALGVSYKGVSLDVANEINSALVPLYREFDVEQMGGIIAPAGNTKLGQQISGAIAGYSPIRKGYILNRKSLKNLKTAQEAFDGESAVLKNLLEHPEKYDFTKLSKSTLGIIQRSKVSGRATVPRSIQEALQHEFGHALERKVRSSSLWPDAEKNMPEYADRISGYAGESKGEYIAESFVSFMKGEGVADPVLVRIFESIRRK
jgi:hypothetical protein